MSTLIDMLNKIQADPELTKNFMKDPVATLQGQGIDTSTLKVTKTTDNRSGWVRADATPDSRLASDLSEGNVDALNRLPEGMMRPTICGSIGYIVCGSVGD